MPCLIAPDVGALVEYGRDSFNRGPGLYRVSSWMRVTVKPVFDRDELAGMLEEILFDACQEINGNRMQWCTREEATHLGLSGICGTIAPIEACKVTGMVDWPLEQLEEARRSARRLGERHEMLF